MTEAQIVIRLIDKFSADLNLIKRTIGSFTENTNRAIAGTATQFSSFSKTVASSALSFAKSMLLMGGAALGLQKGITTLMDFEDARARVVGLAGLKGKDVQTLTASALKIGGSTEFDPADVMGGFGVNARFIKDIQRLKDVVAVETDLATIGQTTITAVAQDMAPLVGILGLSGQQLIEFGDIIAFVNSKNSKSLSSNLEAMTKSIDVMRLYGNTTKDTAAILAIAPAVSAFEGSELGTNLRSMMNGLDATTRLARKGNIDNVNVLRQLGLSPDDIDLTKRKLIDVLTVISKARNRDGTTANGTQFGQLFGEEGKVLAAALVPAVDQIKEVTKQLDNVKGKLGEMSAPMRETLRASVGNAIGAVESLIVKMGDAGLTTAIISAAKAFESFFNFLADNPFIVSLITNVLIAVTALWSLKKIMGLLTIAWGFLRTQILITRVAMLLAGGGANALKIGFLGLGVAMKGLFMANPLGWIFIALQALYELYNLWKKFTGESSTPQADGGKSTPKNGAFWQGSDGKMTPYTQQSKQTVQSDVNINISGLPKGASVDVQQRGASGMNVGTTNISYAGIVGSLF